MRPFNQSRPISLLPRIIMVAGLVVVFDLLVKWAITRWIGPDATRHARWLIGDAVGFEYVRNTGAAFGIFRGNPELLAAIALIVAIGFVWLIVKEIQEPRLAILASGLLAGGSIGNMLERVVRGYVTDFVALGFWPRFNVADSAITVGVLVFVAAMLWGSTVPEEPGTEGEHMRDR